MVTLNPTKLLMGINHHDMHFRRKKVRKLGFCVVCEESRKQGSYNCHLPSEQEKGSPSKMTALYSDSVVVLSVLSSEQEEDLERPQRRRGQEVQQTSGKRLVDYMKQQD